MARRLPSVPPVLPGFSHVHVLGSGGFADVFLFEQNMPRRQVAVKVLLSEVVNDQVRQMFQAEANHMAQLSAHPSILTVYEAGVSSDGRPYLVMELCSSTLATRYRTERLPVAEVLKIAIQIGSAIETAHRAGVLHRDIKPSNILTTAYGHPVLSDFGIASTLGDHQQTETLGMSIPWSAPEVLMDETAGTIESEVWAFAATVYSLLAGRSPFEIPGQPNKSADLISRINRAKSHPIGRPDVPASLGRILARALSRRPDSRQHSIIEIVHELQAVETELGLSQTPVEALVDEWMLSSMSDLEDRTRVRAIAAGTGTVFKRRQARRALSGEPYTPAGAVERASKNPRAESATGAPAHQPREVRNLTRGLIVAGAVILALVAALVFFVSGASPSGIPVVSNIEARVSSGKVVFTWLDPGIEPTDSYRIITDDGQSSLQRDSQFTANSQAGQRLCVTVLVNRAGRDGQPSAEKCVDSP